MSRALQLLWATIAMVCLASVIMVVVVARKCIASTKGQIELVAAYGVALLASYVVIVFGLMVVFNC